MVSVMSGITCDRSYAERPAGTFTTSCQNHGVHDTSAMSCRCDNTYSGFECQFKGRLHLLSFAV